MKLLRINLIFSLLLLLIMMFISLSPAEAATMSVAGLQIDFSVALSQTQVLGTQAFSLSTSATAHCLSDVSFPLSAVSEARITGRIVAINNLTGGQVSSPLTANDYVISIANFPKKVGQPDLTISQVVQLQFPPGSESGNYDIVGLLMKAEGVVGVPIRIDSLLSDNQKNKLLAQSIILHLLPLQLPVQHL